jgi:heterodisulfide reductase subunit A-like polyferredoxin
MQFEKKAAPALNCLDKLGKYWVEDIFCFFSLRDSLNLKECYMSDNVYGSVLVVGAGIAGMQSALDLAESGYYVYLLERSSAIGGLMSQLDKTFPTNDCTM